ncbi:MAG: hypothetical protein ACYSUB_01885 [Planctomycetota bacterium]|jgi:hypothetical protein
MNLHSKAHTLVSEIAISVALDERPTAKKLAHRVLKEAQTEAEPRLKELEAEVTKLKDALAYHYYPTSEELESWARHCSQIDSCGGSPPSETEWWVYLALSHWEHRGY